MGLHLGKTRVCPIFQLIPIVSTDINECDVAMCLNGATCEDVINSYNCLCQTGFTGNMCETGR